MVKDKLLSLEEAAEHIGITPTELKLSRQRGLKPGSLGRVENGQLVFKRSELLGAPRTSSSRRSSSAGAPTHIGGGWFELSDGTRIRGKEAATKAQSKLEG